MFRIAARSTAALHASFLRLPLQDARAAWASSVDVWRMGIGARCVLPSGANRDRGRLRDLAC
eukprot:3086679-Pleurochrysis_carterae.AAC.4